MSTYNKQTWTNGVSPTSAERMTHIENGIKSAQDDANLANTRISSIATLPEGSTTGDAELIDARTTYDGFTFASLGACTRKMQEDAKDNYDTLDGKIDTKVSELNNDLVAITKSTRNLFEINCEPFSHSSSDFHMTVADDNNSVTFSGTPTITGVYFIGDVTLEAGVYSVSGFDSDKTNDLKIQIRDWTDGSDHGGIMAGTTTTGSFTLTETKRVALRVSWTANVNYSITTVRPQIEKGNYVTPFIQHKSANDLTALSSQLHITSTDLNELTKNGFYYINSVDTPNLTNAPEGITDSSNLYVFENTYNYGSFITQILQTLSGGIYTRFLRKSPLFVGSWFELSPNEKDNEKGTYIAFGDSITKGYAGDTQQYISKGYPYWVGVYKNMTVVNTGVGGSGYLKVGNNETAKSIVDKQTYTGDLFTLSWGVNDYTAGETLGTPNDEIDADTVCGKMKYCIKKLQTDCPKAKIVVLSPQLTSAYGVYPNYALSREINGKTLQDFVDAEKGVCDKMHVTFIDMINNGLINSENVNSVLADYTHPKAEMYKPIGRVISGLIPFIN